MNQKEYDSLKYVFRFKMWAFKKTGNKISNIRSMQMVKQVSKCREKRLPIGKQ